LFLAAECFLLAQVQQGKASESDKKIEIEMEAGRTAIEGSASSLELHSESIVDVPVPSLRFCTM
jgi:hypothetical protein